jgi:N-acetylmuramoyl-L-alanine amidase
MPRLVVSAAHTSISPGAVYQDLREFDLTRKILQFVIPHLEKQKIDFQAVPADIQLLQRIDWINNTGYTEEENDIFLEIHVNDGGKRGIESWFSGKAGDDNKSEEFAKAISDDICKATGYENQGAKSEHEHELGSLLILNQTKPIATAIEFLYIDNPEDNKILKDDKKLDDLAKKLAEALKKYIDILAKKPKSPPKPKAPAPNPFNFGNDSGSDDPFADPFGFGGDTGFGDPFGKPAAPAASSTMLMDRESREKMIKETYKKVLGKDPKESDVTYYLNIGLTEQQLLDKLVKTKEFSDMVKDAEEAKELRETSKKSEAELIQLRAKVSDLERMHLQLNELLKHQREQIRTMHQELVNRNIIKNGEYFDPTRIKR